MKKLKLVLLILLLATCYLLPATVHGQATSLSVSPPLIEIEAIPPTTLETPIAIRNDSEEPVELEAVFKPFIASPKANGEIQFLSERDAFPGANKRITERLKIRDNGRDVTTIRLGPNETKTLDLYVGVPDNEPHSDYYFAVIFLPPAQQLENSSEEDEDNVASVRGGIGVNVLLSVGPRDDPKALIEEFSAPALVQSGPVPFTVMIKNTGSHYFTPTGTIIIENMFGQKIGKVDLLEANVLSGTTRAFINEALYREALQKQDKAEKNGDTGTQNTEEIDDTKALWPEVFLVGPYTATLEVSLSPDGPVLTRQTRFFAFPGHVLVALIVLLIMLFVVRQRLRRKLIQ